MEITAKVITTIKAIRKMMIKVMTMITMILKTTMVKSCTLKSEAECGRDQVSRDYEKYFK